MGNLAGTTSYTYDDLGRLSTETTGDVQKTYTYDANNNLKTYVLTKNSVAQMNLSYEYDYKNRLHYVLDSGIIVAEYNYDANGNRSTITYNGQTTSYAYNLANMMTELENKKGTTTLSKYNYEYYTSGNQYKKTSLLDGVTTYTYDGLGRLASEITPNETLSYDYTDANNRKNLTVTNSASPYVVNYSYDKNNRLTRQEKVQGSTTNISEFNYDYNGNLLNELKSSINPLDSQSESISMFVAGNGTGLSLYDYDGWNRQIKATVDNTTSSYTYNADGLRTSKTVNGTLTGFILEGGNVVAETNTSGISNKYVYGNGLLYRSAGGQKTFYNYNGHGDVTQLTDSTGSVIKNYTYDAFGNEKNADANDTNPFRYCSEYYDKETGSIYLRARYYSPSIGRFISEDSARDGMNWYAYCNNNAVNLIDPTGNYYTKPNSDGTCNLVRDSRLSALVKSIIITAVPCGDLMIEGSENTFFRYNGGNSKTYTSGDSFVLKMFQEGGGALAKKGLFWYGLYDSAPKVISGMDISYQDDIAFGLLSKAGVGITNINKDYAEGIMVKAYSFIESFKTYFSTGLGDVYDNKTMHRIDYELSISKNPSKDIKRYENNVINYYIGAGYDYMTAQGAANASTSYLEDYSKRRQELFEKFTKYIYQ